MKHALKLFGYAVAGLLAMFVVLTPLVILTGGGKPSPEPRRQATRTGPSRPTAEFKNAVALITQDVDAQMSKGGIRVTSRVADTWGVYIQIRYQNALPTEAEAREMARLLARPYSYLPAGTDLWPEVYTPSGDRLVKRHFSVRGPQSLDAD